MRRGLWVSVRCGSAREGEAGAAVEEEEKEGDEKEKEVVEVEVEVEVLPAGARGVRQGAS